MKGDKKVIELLNEALKNELTATNQYWLLDRLPNFQALGRLHIGENVEEILRGDMELEVEALGQLRGAIGHCEKVHDYVSRDLFADILENEEQHVDTLEQQFEMIARMGLPNYVQLQSEPAKD